MHDEVAPVREPVRGAEGLVALAEDGRAHVETVAVLKPLVEAPGGVVAPEEYVLGRALHGSERAYRGVEAMIGDAVLKLLLVQHHVDHHRFESNGRDEPDPGPLNQAG